MWYNGAVGSSVSHSANLAKVVSGVDGGAGWKGDVKFMLLSIDKLQSLGWKPTLTSRQSIEMAVTSLLG